MLYGYTGYLDRFFCRAGLRPAPTRHVILHGCSIILCTHIVALILCIPWASRAEIWIRDDWAASGRLALEGADWSAAFSREDGALSVYSGAKEAVKIVPQAFRKGLSERGNQAFGKGLSEKAQAILSCEVIEKARGRVGVKASFSAGQEQIEGEFFFDRGGALEVKPMKNMKGFYVFGEIRFGIVPAPPLEDLIYDPEEYASAGADAEGAFHVYLPSGNLFLGLLEGEDGLLFCAWPPGGQGVKLLLEDGGEEGKVIRALELQLDGKSAYLMCISAPGIWHREELPRTYLEKDMEIDWKRPFPAIWKTQLLEGEIETAFHFRTRKDTIWRPNFGFYDYPAWFEGEKAFFHLSKKVPPSGQVLIYALEGHRDTPVEFAKEHIGHISTLKSRAPFRHYPRDNVGIQHCDGRAWVKWIFKVGFQTREKNFLQEAMDDFLYSINVEKVRLEEYEAFIPRMREKIGSWMEKEDDPEVRIFLGQMKERVDELDREYWDKMDASPASEHLREETEVINQLKTLFEEESLEVYPEACYLLDRIQLWSLMESVPGRVGGLFRELFQQAGYGCAYNANAIKYAEEIRRDVRDFLINGESYETIYPQLWD